MIAGLAILGKKKSVLFLSKADQQNLVIPILTLPMRLCLPVQWLQSTWLNRGDDTLMSCKISKTNQQSSVVTMLTLLMSCALLSNYRRILGLTGVMAHLGAVRYRKL